MVVDSPCPVCAYLANGRAMADERPNGHRQGAVRATGFGGSGSIRRHVAAADAATPCTTVACRAGKKPSSWESSAGQAERMTVRPLHLRCHFKEGGRDTLLK